jgi:sulfide:quinone oxidoreductase
MMRTVVLGAGFGGLTAATELAAARIPGHDITLVDERDAFLMGLAKLEILDGRRSRSLAERRLRDVERHGVAFVKGRVEAIGERDVTVRGERLPFDHLVLALGARLVPEAVPGLAEHALDLYSVSGIEAIHRELARHEPRDVLVLVTSLPFKCPPAPYEAAMLARAYLDQHVGEGAGRVALATPEPQPLPIAGRECGDVVRAWVEERGVEYLPGKKVARVEPGVVRFEDGTTRSFDVLAAVPPHAPPSVLGEWVPADAATLSTARGPNVWAVGDCNVVKLANGKPLVKAGVMAEGEASVVARNLVAKLRGEAPTARFEGRGGCFLELGRGEAVEVAGDFYAQPNPIVATLSAPSAAALRKKEAFERERLQRWFGS